MTDWEPASEAEAALRDALRTGDQELYFRILARIELLLPVSPEAMAGRSPVGWGTWTSGGRTHVLAFTSAESMRACLAEHAGSFRRVAYHELAAAWPNQEWWLAINPGLPIEGYLPSWFVAQLSRGDVRLPGRTLGARARVAAVSRPRGAAPVPLNDLAPPGVGRSQPPEMAPPRPLEAPGSRAMAQPAHAFSAPAAPAAPAAPPAPLPSPVRGSHAMPGSPAGYGPPAEQAGRARVPAHAAPPEPPPPPAPAPEPEFEPANDVEADLLVAAGEGQTDNFLSTLLLAKVLVPVPEGGNRKQPGEAGFEWRREEVEGQPYVVVFTSPERMAEHLGTVGDAVTVKFVQLIRSWPDESWSFAVNPGTPVGATLPGTQIRALAAWAAEVGLSDEPSVEFETAEAPAAPASRPAAERPVVMQKPIAPTQVAYFLERGYDRVSGFVHRAGEVAHLTTPEQMYQAFGLGYPGSPFKPSDDEVYVLRWTAYRPNLYRIPYGGRDEAGMRAMQGWVIERPPFRGNGFAPSESSDVIAEFKVDSARLPHGAQMWRMTREGKETLVALLDADGPRWLPMTGDQAGPDPERER